MARIIEVEGRRLSVPDDATDDEINNLFAPTPAAPAQAEPAIPMPPERPMPGIPELSQLTQAPEANREIEGPRPAPQRELRAGVQGAARSLSDIAAFPIDLLAMGENALLAGGDKFSRLLGGPSIDMRAKMPSDIIADTASKAAGAFGYDVMDPEAMSSREKLAYNVNRFGGQAAAGAGGLAKAGIARGAELAKSAPNMFDDFLRPYFTNPVKTAAGDAVAGAGAGAGLTASQMLPEDVRSMGGGTVGVGTDLLAMLAGGVGGGTAAEIATRAPVSVVRNFKGSMNSKEAGFDPETLLPTTNRAVDKAARFVQSQAIDPEAAAQNIGRRSAEFSQEGLPVPTSGIISGDTGVEMLERGSRVNNSTGTIIRSPDASPEVKKQYSFGERDNALRDSAVQQVDSIRGDGNPEAFVQRAEQVGDAQVEAAQRKADQAAGKQRSVEIAQEAPANDLQAFEGQGKRASRNIDTTYRDTRQRELARSRRLYQDPELVNAQVGVDPMVQVSDELRTLDTAAAPLDPTVRKYVDRFRRPEVDEETGVVLRPGFEEGQQFTMREANAVRAEIERDIQQNLDNGETVRQLRRLKNTVSAYVDDLAADGNDAAQAAVSNYTERVRPNFREGAGGRMNDRMVADPNGTKVRPSDTAGEFLTRPEDAADLMRISRLRGPGAEQQTAGDARTWLFDQLAQRGVVKDGAIDPEKLTRWRNRNNDLLGEVPGLRQEVDGMLRDARRGADLNTRYGAELKAAETKVSETRRDVDKGPLGMVAEKAPDKAVAAVFSSGNPESAMKELAKRMGGGTKNLPATEPMKGLKAAVADHFEAKVSNINPSAVSDGSQTIGYTKLVKEFQKNERALAAVFSADEMNALRRAQKLLEPLGKLRGQATSGSITAENNEAAWKTVEAATKLWFGMLKGGGIMRSMKLAASTLADDSTEQANRLVARMMFDPDLAKHLLTRKTAEVGSPGWNSTLQKIIRRTQAVKTLQEQDEE
jgi:hypothetical protein